jgi:peroxiredoxin Q/BCP
MSRTFRLRVACYYLIGPDGKVAQRWDDVKVDGHAEAVLAAVRAL